MEEELNKKQVKKDLEKMGKQLRESSELIIKVYERMNEIYKLL